MLAPVTWVDALPMIAEMAWKATVHREWSESVLRTRRELGAAVSLTFSPCEDVETNKHDVVEQQHDRSCLVCQPRSSRIQMGGDITDIPRIRILHAPLPQDITCVCCRQ